MSDGGASLELGDLVGASAVEGAGAGRYAARVPEGWRQGRGAFGGLVIAQLARALEHEVAEPERALRWLAAEIMAPVLVGETEITVELLRKGSAVSTLEARLCQQGELLARATGVFGRARDYTRRWQPAPPAQLPDWREIAVAPVAAPLAPEFVQHFEFRVTGPMPMSGGADPVSEGFIRPRRPLEALGAPELAALADVFWPAFFAIEHTPRPVGTVAFTLQPFVPEQPHDPRLPVFQRARAVAAHGGYTTEFREVFTLEGELIAQNQQSFVVIK